MRRVAEEARVGEVEGLAELGRALLRVLVVLQCRLLALALAVALAVGLLLLLLLQLQPLLLAQSGFLVLLRRAGSLQQQDDVLEVQVMRDEGWIQRSGGVRSGGVRSV